MGAFVSVVDQTSVNLALPRIAAHFEATIPAIQWVALAYALTTLSLLMPMGRLGDLFGRKRLYVLGFTLFTLGAVLAGFSPSLGAVIGFKVFQGVGAAMVQGTGFAIVTAAFSDKERGKVIGLFLTIAGAGAIPGLVLGGLAIDAFGWRAAFFMAVPVGLLSVVAGQFLLRDDTAAVRRLTAGDRFD